MQPSASIPAVLACNGLLTDEDLRVIEDAAYGALLGAEDGEYDLDVELPGGRSFFGTVKLTTWGHVDIGAEFMGQYEYIGVTDDVRVEFISAELWDETGEDGRDILGQMQEAERDIEGLLL